MYGANVTPDDEVAVATGIGEPSETKVAPGVGAESAGTLMLLAPPKFNPMPRWSKSAPADVGTSDCKNATLTRLSAGELLNAVGDTELRKTKSTL